VIVADTNLLVYLYLPGEHTAAAERVVSIDAEWASPILWRSEFRNVLALYLRKQMLGMDAAVDAFREAESAVRGREYAMETTRVLHLVQNSTCSAYDCEFVALAQELGVPLITSDARLLKDFPAIAIAPDEFAA
jgi:predicted nucleic acid-binding protein